MSVLGLRVGPFEIIEPVSLPEAGDWYLARRAGLTQRQPHEVLVKLLPPDAGSEDRAELQRQFETLRALDDPRVPTPVAFYEGIGALAVSVVRGDPLGRVVELRSQGDLGMTPATVLDIAVELAECLQHAHHRGRLHGHLSPEQVLLAPDGHLWVLGLGPGPQVAAAPAWQAPELARGDEASPATDQWALGALVSSLITGRVAWPGGDREALRGEVDVGPVESQWPALARVLRQMLATNPAHRLDGLSQVRQELLALARKAGGASERRDLGGFLGGRVSSPPVGARAALATASPSEDLPVVRPEGVQVARHADDADRWLGVDADADDLSVLPTEQHIEHVPDADPTEAMPDRIPTEMASIRDLTAHETEVVGNPELGDGDDPELKPSVVTKARLLILARATGDVDAELLLDPAQLREDAIEAQLTPVGVVRRGEGRLTVNRKATQQKAREVASAARDADEEISDIVDAKVLLDTASVMAAVNEPSPGERRVPLGSDVFAVFDDDDDDEDYTEEATVLIDSAALFASLAGGDANLMAILTDDEALSAEVEVVPTDGDGPLEAVVQVLPTEPGLDTAPPPRRRPTPPVHGPTMVPPSDPDRDDFSPVTVVPDPEPTDESPPVVEPTLPAPPPPEPRRSGVSIQQIAMVLVAGFLVLAALSVVVWMVR